jgi:hypothetical protein
MRSISTKIFLTAITLAASLAANGQQVAPPKLRVGIMPATDRWVTLTDGSRVYQGLDISYLLGQKIFGSSAYIPVMLAIDPVVNMPLAPQTSRVASNAVRLTQIPKEWMTWTSDPAVVALNASPAAQRMLVAKETTTGGDNAFPVAVDITITPIVETLMYASGQKSDRVVFGFSPDHLNPFNAGEAGSLDNQYVASAAQLQACSLPDFFNGQLNPAGWGPWAGNFGANMDEGFSFQILGYGLAFKHKSFTVQSQIRFLVDDNRTGAHDEYVFQTSGSGTDVFVDGSYNGINLGIEIARTHTLIDALKAMLPQIVDGLLSQGLAGAWQNSIVSLTPAPTLGAGVNEGVNVGLKLVSPFGNTYEVITVDGTTSVLEKVGGTTQPFVGEPLQVDTGQPIQWISQASQTQVTTVRAARLVAGTSTAATMGTNQKVIQSTVAIPMNTTARAATQVASLPCFDQTSSGLTSTIDNLFTLYGYYRYENVLDQAPHQDLSTIATSGVPKIALIDSGVDYNDKALTSHFVGTSARQVLGFDFISWDPRPSDDNGHGTAAVKLLASLLKSNFIIVPAKVIGAYGETHSSAVYDAFTYAINNHVDAILVPWSSEAGTLEAYQMGARNAAAAGIPVFVAPNTVLAGTNIFVPTIILNKTFETSGLEGSSVQLGPDGVATVQLLAQWISTQFLGGTK